MPNEFSSIVALLAMSTIVSAAEHNLIVAFDDRLSTEFFAISATCF
jgi:hypothetical protein